MRGTYLYAVMAGEPHLDLGSSGLPDGATEVVGLSSDGLTAVVSEYEGPALHGRTRAELLQSLVIHQRVIEQAMAGQSVLPVKFGTILASREEVRQALGRFRDRLTAALGEVGDALEIDLSATWHLEVILADVARDPVVAGLAASAQESNDEALATRMQVGQAVAETVERRRDEYRRRVVNDLMPLVRDAQPNPLPTEDLVFNLAFLVERQDLPQFESTVDRLGEELGDRLTFRYVGPLPPHSFATVELTRPDPDEIASARRILELGEWFSPAELRHSYRDIAARSHPDRNPGNPTAQERFAAITAANEALARYVEGQRETGTKQDEERQIDASPDAVKRALLLAIRRADIEPGTSG